MIPSLKVTLILGLTALACSSTSSPPEDSAQPIDEGALPIEDTQSMDLGAEDSFVAPQPDVPSVDPGPEDTSIEKDTAPAVDTAPPAPCPASPRLARI